MARYSVDYDGDLSTTDDRVSYGSFDAATGAIGNQGFGSYSIQDNRRGGGGNLGSFGSDEAGRRAGFGALNDARSVGGFGLLGGLLGNRPFGVIGADGARTGILADMFNGGGRGASGNTFQGGLLSGLLNAIGIRPIGFSQTQQPQMTEEQVRAQMGNAPSVMAPPPAVMQPAVTPDPYSPRGRAAPMSASPEYFSPGLPAPDAMTTPSRPPIPSTGPVTTQTRPLTAADIVRLRNAGRAFDAQVGLAATPEEIMFLDAQVAPATRRYMSSYGIPTGRASARTTAPAPNPSLLPRTSPDIGALQRYLNAL